MQNHSCLCLQCGRGFTMALEESANINEQKCPVCGGNNVIEQNTQNFFQGLFGFTGGG